MQKTSPLISIIVPFYNPGEALHKCLDSLLAQTLKNLEILLINDGSSDCSVKISREYRNAHAGIILHEGPNQGVSAARNRGLQLARGECIYFCDADDFIAPELCEFLYSRLTSSDSQLATCALVKGKQLDEVVCNVPAAAADETWDQERILRDWYLPLQRGSRYARAEVRGYLPCCLFRREIIEQHQIRFTCGLSMNEDEIFLLEYLIHSRKAILSNRPLYFYCYSDNSLCANFFIHQRVPAEIKQQAFVLRAEKTRQIFEKSGLAATLPALHAELLLNESFQRVRKITLARETRFREKLHNTRKIISALRSTSAWNIIWQNKKKLPCTKQLFFLSMRLGPLATLACSRLKKSVR